MTEINPFEDSAVREVLLTEYRSLRDEIFKKMDHRTSLSIALVTASMVALGAGIERRSSGLLLVVPLITVLFGLLIAFNNYSIYGITAHLRDVIETQFSDRNEILFRWHNTRKPNSRRFKELVIIYHIPNILIVVVPAFAAVIGAWTLSDAGAWVVLLTILDVILLVLYSVIYRKIAWGSVHIEIPRKPRSS